MERRWFTNGVRTDFAATPADAVMFVHDGWRECEAPSASDETELNPADENVEPNPEA